MIAASTAAGVAHAALVAECGQAPSGQLRSPKRRERDPRTRRNSLSVDRSEG